MTVSDFDISMQSNVASSHEEAGLSLDTSFKDSLTHRQNEVMIEGQDPQESSIKTANFERELTSGVFMSMQSELLSLNSLGEAQTVDDTVCLDQSCELSIKGVVKADDKEFHIDINVKMQSTLTHHQKILLTDPLIISLPGAMPTLSNKTFNFDIDNNGMSDQISQLTKGNGFLALDSNENGIIDNGSELFGPQSGNGFGDLSKHDSDGNGFIDENDPIFDKLRIWMKTDEEDRLVGLGEVGLGAIYLHPVGNEYSFINGETNNKSGVMKNNAFALFEDGQSSLVSEIHLNKQQQNNSELDRFQLRPFEARDSLEQVSTNVLLALQSEKKRLMSMLTNVLHKGDAYEEKRVEALREFLASLTGRLNESQKADATV